MTPKCCRYAIANKQGALTRSPEFIDVEGFSEDLAHVRTGIDYYSAKRSYIEKSGKPVFTDSGQSKRRR